MKEIKKIILEKKITIKEAREYNKEKFVVLIIDKIYLKDLVELSTITNDNYIGIYPNDEFSIKLIIDL